jgi:CubicO group peptidase (beta-lactamase class C family)
MRALLSHTAGLADYTGSDVYHAAVAARPGEPWDLDQVLAVSLKRPGSAAGAVRYCNAGYWILGAVLERASRMPLAEILAAEVFGPAAMTDTAYPGAKESLTADGYSTLWAGPAGAAWSTARDLDKFLAALLNTTLLTAGDQAIMRQATLITTQHPWPAPGYGLGVMTDATLRTIGHGGSGPGYQAAAFTLVSGDRSAVVLATQGATPDPARQAVRWLSR